MRQFLGRDISLFKRREFISNAMKAAGATVLLTVPGGRLVAATSLAKEYTVQDIIDLILKEIPGAPFKETVDTIKSGDAKQKVRGVITTMFATVNVIEEAAKINANLIIAHEPTFYNHKDDTKWVEPNKVLKQKQELLDKHKIVVWRFHDYWHTHKPDGVLSGVLKKAGWSEYYKEGQSFLTIPAITLKDLAMHLKSSLEINQVRVIGRLDQQCRKISLIPGAGGGQMQISVVEKEQPDVLIVGEVNEWETAEYIRDMQLLGGETSLIILGHSVVKNREWSTLKNGYNLK